MPRKRKQSFPTICNNHFLCILCLSFFFSLSLIFLVTWFVPHFRWLEKYREITLDLFRSSRSNDITSVTTVQIDDMIEKLTFRALPLRLSLWRTANARNVSFSISLRWSIYIINSVDKPNFRVSLPHRRSTTVSSETNPLYSMIWLV